MRTFPPYEPPAREVQYHSPVTITLGELVEGGFVDLTAAEWQWDFFDEAQRDRVNEKILNRFWYREIGCLPPSRWKREFLRVINETMPKLKPLYQYIADGGNLLADSDEYGKGRTIYSEFPQTSIGGQIDNQDYASNGTDKEYETIRTGNYLDQALRVQNEYNDIDVMLLDALKVTFSSLISLNMNGW